MEISSLKKELRLITDDNADLFVKHSEIEPHINFVEEFWLTSDETLGNDRAYFDSYAKALQYANSIYAYHASQNEDGSKPFLVRINGKELNGGGSLNAYLDSEG